MFQTIFEWILLPVWFSLPGIIANIMPGAARSWPGGTKPVSERILGPNKTWMAIPAALLGAHLTVTVQLVMGYPGYNYPNVPWYLLGICFGLGAPLGDWCKSLLKRLIGIEPGGKWWFEKIDFLVMSYLFLWILGVALPVQYYVVPIMLMCIIHGPGNRFAYQMGWRNSPH